MSLSERLDLIHSSNFFRIRELCELSGIRGLGRNIVQINPHEAYKTSRIKHHVNILKDFGVKLTNENIVKMFYPTLIAAF